MEVIFIKIGFIGAGKVGFSLGKYLKENNVNVTGYYSKNNKSSKEACNFTETKQYFTLKEILNESDTIFITTPDMEISNVWNEIKKYPIKDKIICHFSGLLSSEIFSNIHKFGAYGYSIHPMFAISDKYNSYKDLKNAFITIEGDPKFLETIYDLFKDLGNSVKIINKENKSLYHLSSVMVSNVVVGLMNNSINYLNSCGFTKEEALEALYPLALINLKNINSKGVTKSLTGPVERGDLKTLQSHFRSIPKKDREMYRILSKNLTSIAKAKNENRDYKKLEEFLERDYEEYSNNI